MNYLARGLVIILFLMATACSVPWLTVLPKGEPLEPAASSPSSSEPKPGAGEGHQVGKEGISEKSGTDPQENFLEKQLSQAPERKILPPEGGASPSSPGPVSESGKNQLPNPQFLLGEALKYFRGSRDLWEKGDIPKATAALDQAYRLLLRVNPEGDQGLAREKENIRLMICKRMIEMHAARHTSVRGTQKAIPLVLNHYVKREIKIFQGPERKIFLEAYKRSGRYRPLILAALEKAGLPRELSWLPLIESEFRTGAFSQARALGLWQFIPSTGYLFGLKRDRWIDERMDPQKSTRAAIAYLRELHNIFGDWCTVLAAYNCGDARVLEVIRGQRVNYLDDFWDHFEKLPPETARYVPRFIAALLIIGDPARFGFDLRGPPPPVPCESVRISKQMSLKDVAHILGVSPESIRGLNPELRFNVTPAGPYDLKVPERKGALLLARLNESPTSGLPPKGLTLHRVQSGETLGQLASRYHTSVQAIVDTNHIREKDFLRVGQKLRIPPGGGRANQETEVEGETIPTENPQPRRYRVKKGDCLWKIVELYQTSLKEVMRLNNLESTHIQIDQELLIPPGR